MSSARARSAPARAAESAAGSSSSSRTASVRASTSSARTTRPAPYDSIGSPRPADVVGNRGYAGPERLEERARLVELGAVREDGDRRVRERPVELCRREIAETPLDALGGAKAVERHRGIARDEQAGIGEPARDLDRVGEPLVRTDHAQAQDRVPVVGMLRGARVDGVGDHGRVDAEVGEGLAPSLAVHDDAVEAAQDSPPQASLGGGAPRQQVMGGEDRGRAEAQLRVELREREPLDMQDVGAQAGERCDARPGARLPSPAGAPATGERAGRTQGRRAARRYPSGSGGVPKRNGDVTSSTSAPARASAAASSWSYHGVNAGGSATTTRTEVA